jgi:2-succinyl-5-enolpyruvyl-6-hydroxy-3-cyclohexene-1-carboxylate synthase
MNTDKRGAIYLTEVLIKKGVKHVVISPGSRNAPLIATLTNNDFFTCYSIVDERSAGFFALGISQIVKDTVAVVCTSGSALLNLAPAVAEAFYQRLPLLVISADRPREWVNQGESQTFNQSDVFKNYVRASFDLVQEPESPDDIWYQNRQISEAINKTRTPYWGPVHLNIRFKEPLYQRSEAQRVSPLIVNEVPTVPAMSSELQNQFKLKWESFEKIMIICGAFPPNDAVVNTLKSLARKGVVVLTESTSNLHADEFFSCIDKIIEPAGEQEKTKLKPDLLISIGGPLISRKIKNYLRQITVEEHWHVDPIDHYQDAYQHQNQAIAMNANDFLVQFENLPEKKSTYYSIWKDLNETLEKKHTEYLKNLGFSDLKVFETLMNNLPDTINMHVANSSAIRYVQLFKRVNSVSCFSNRGTSGIEGSVSTAVGASYLSEKTTVLITGDLALMYDSNGLWNNYVSPRIKIIVINNGGGGIFRIIPGPTEIPRFETFIETKQHSDFSGLAAMHNLAYFVAHDIKSLEKGLSDLMKETNRAAILEIKTAEIENDRILKEYFDYLRISP